MIAASSSNLHLVDCGMRIRGFFSPDWTMRLDQRREILGDVQTHRSQCLTARGSAGRAIQPSHSGFVWPIITVGLCLPW